MWYKLYGTNSEKSLSDIRSWKFLIVMVFSLFYQLPQMILTEFMAVLLGLWHFWAIYGAISPDKLGYGLIRAPKRLCGSRNFSWHWQPFFMPWKEISNYDMLLTLWKWQRITQYEGIPARFSFDTLSNPAKQPKLRACSSTTKLQKEFPRKIRQNIFPGRKTPQTNCALFLYFPWISSQVFFPPQKCFFSPNPTGGS